MANFGLIGRLVIVTVVLVISILFIVNSRSGEVAEQVINSSGIDVSFVRDNIPCLTNCLTSLKGDELAILSSGSFDNIDYSSLLPEWFPCNRDVMVIALLVNELARWDNDNGVLVRSSDYSFDKVKNLLFTCLDKPNTDVKCVDNFFSFFNFCSEDDYLKGYGFVPCGSLNSFYDFVSKDFFVFDNRAGYDISDDFVCKGSGFSLCSSSPAAFFDRDYCQPAWITLNAQETVNGKRSVSKARCEDFALLYYSLFRAIDVQPDDLTLNIGYCDLPCSCKRLARDYGLDYNVTYCLVPANLTVKGLGSISGCGDYNFNGRAVINGYKGDNFYTFVVNQTFSNYAYYRNLSFNANYSDDLRYFNNGVVTLASKSYDLSSYDGSYNVNVYSQHTYTYFFRTYVSSYLSPPIVISVSDLSQGYDGTFGFKLKINDLTNCDNVTVSIGFLNGGRKSFLFNEGESRPVFYKGNVTGNPFYLFYSVNKDCVVDYSVSSMSLVINDPCVNYNAGINQLISDCDNYIIEGYYYDETGARHESDSIRDLIE